jgi:hypothetical protein
MSTGRNSRFLLPILALVVLVGQSLAATPLSLPPPRGSSSLDSWGSSYFEPEGQWQASFGISSLTYLAPPTALPRSQFSIARFSGKYSRIGNELEVRVDSRIGVGLDCGWECSSIEFTEAAIGSSRRLGPVSFHVGRLLAPWSLVDDEWRMGVFQPRFVYDFLHPQRVGLLGAFLKVETPRWKLTVFGSPGFVPDRGLPITVDNGRIGSIDPFFHTPISEVIYEGRTTPISYRLNRPPLTDLLLRPGFGVVSQFGGSEGWSLTTAYAFKPVNQVLLAYNNLYNLSFEVADADLFPRVVMHHLASSDLKYSQGKAYGALSLVREVPVMDSVPAAWTAQQLAPAWLISPQVGWRGEKEFQATASYLRVQGGNAPDRKADSGPKVVDGVSVFDLRYPFTNALRLSASNRFWTRGAQSMNWRTQVILDLDRSAQVYMHSLTYQPSASWQLRVATDILVGQNSGKDFISRNRSNDRFFGGLSYVF